MKTEYLVQFNHPDELDEWIEDDRFDSLGEAMDHIASECLRSIKYEHRVVRTGMEELVRIPALEGKI